MKFKDLLFSSTFSISLSLSHFIFISLQTLEIGLYLLNRSFFIYLFIIVFLFHYTFWLCEQRPIFVFNILIIINGKIDWDSRGVCVCFRLSVPAAHSHQFTAIVDSYHLCNLLTVPAKLHLDMGMI